MTPLESALKQRVDGEVYFGSAHRALYAADASNYRKVPLGVVVPRSVEDIAHTVTVCAEHGAAIVHRGGGTALAGQTVSDEAVIIDSSKYCNHILSLDSEARLVTVEPGVVLDDLRDAAEEYGLTFGPDPSTHNRNTLGGMIGNNSCGTHSVEAHRTADNVHSLDILTYDGFQMEVGATSEAVLDEFERDEGRLGEIYRRLHRLRDEYADDIRARYPKIPRRVSGYNLDELLPERGFHVGRALVGSESTCVSVLRATLQLIPDPPCKLLLVIGFDDVVNAADAVPDILPFRQRGLIALEGMDVDLVHYMKRKHFRTDDLQYLPEGRGWLMAQMGAASLEEAKANARRLQEAMQQHPHVTEMRLLVDADEREALWKVREAGLASTAWVPDTPDTWPGWEDSAVAPERLGEYMRALKRLYAKYGYSASMYGHFGDGLIHTRIDFGLHSAEQVRKYRAFVEEASDLVLGLGGSLSGEHGDGQARSELLPKMFGPRLMDAFDEFKRIWDPQGKMNPHNIVHPHKLDEDLRYGPEFEAYKPDLDTTFPFPESDHSFVRAAMRCVGVGECRKHKGGTMCPSFRGTHDEMHSTRGRARLLQEMLEGHPVHNLWESEEVNEALDLCLSCKACVTECPVNVDMATYRAEFYHHYYRKKARPLASYSMGMVHRWAPLAAHLPRLMNMITQTPVLGSIARYFAGVHPERPLPRFAARTFREQWQGEKGDSKIRAVLWVDSFNNHFTPEPLLAAARLLERCGYRVLLPRKGLCCGRPYYDFGRLDAAKATLAKAMEFLAPMLDDRTWLVGVEASCLSAFREELIKLFPEDARAKHIAEHTLTLGAFLHKFGHLAIHLQADVAIHGHCHQKAVLGMEGEIAVLKASGRKVELLDDGCCGMAGSFGYEKHKYPLSRTIAEQGVKAHLEALPQKVVVAVDGFSCRHQISHFTGRKTITFPELLLQSIDGVPHEETNR